MIRGTVSDQMCFLYAHLYFSYIYRILITYMCMHCVIVCMYCDICRYVIIFRPSYTQIVNIAEICMNCVTVELCNYAKYELIHRIVFDIVEYTSNYCRIYFCCIYRYIKNVIMMNYNWFPVGIFLRLNELNCCGVRTLELFLMEQASCINLSRLHLNINWNKV